MEIPLHPDCRLIKADPSGLMAIEKAAGILSHPNKREDEGRSLLKGSYEIGHETYTVGDKHWYLLNRLDAPTSGLILMADNPELAQKVKDAFAGHSVSKTYLALVRGIPPRQQDSWRDCLKVVRQRGSLRTVVTLGRANAFCDMKLVERGAGPPARALISLHPKTGKTHQLRVQCASRHLAIIGDSTYGDYRFNREFKKKAGLDRLFLHSWKTSLQIEYQGRELKFSAECSPPEAFAIALQ
ncbi:MAG: RluA family pseudouridine synthase [Puniceicoccaceae bacterium]